MKHCIDTQLNLKSILETTGTTYKFKKKVEKKKKNTYKNHAFSALPSI